MLQDRYILTPYIRMEFWEKEWVWLYWTQESTHIQIWYIPRTVLWVFLMPFMVEWELMMTVHMEHMWRELWQEMDIYHPEIM